LQIIILPMAIISGGITMSEKKIRTGEATAVGCDVTNCKYNTIDSKCAASQIKVKNDKATTESETFCGTFCPRGCCD